MKEFEIVMPFTGIATMIIEAESQEEAINKFYEESAKIRIDAPSCDIEWEFTEQIVKGNVFYGVQNEMDVTEHEIDED